MVTTKITLRDFLFLTMGVISTLLIGGFVTFRLHQESLKTDVLEWLKTKKEEVSVIEKESSARLVTNTAEPGTIWVIFESDKFDVNNISKISTWLAVNKCPYGITKISP
jgi:hypothetical protein